MRTGAQLYTVREFCRDTESFAETLKKVADIGYEFVQVSGTCAYEAEWLRDELAKNGLKCAITHTAAGAIKNDTDTVIKNHKTFGCGLIGLGSMPPAADGSLDYDGFAAGFRPAAQAIAAAGCFFMYHNHHFEFERDEKGVRGLEKLAEAFAPSEMGFTLDTYWVQYAGGDPAQWLRMLRGRVPAIHLKDMVCVERTQRMAVVGEGNINFGRVLYEAENAGTEFLLVEQDNCNGEDPFECLKRSYRQLAAWGLY